MVLRGVALAVVACALAVPAAAAEPGLKVVATGLNNPRKLVLGPGGTLYVVEAGTGGRDRCIGSAQSKTCIGLTGAIAKIVGGSVTRVVTGLWSGAEPNGRRAEGPADVIVNGKTFDVLLQDGSITAQGMNYLGPDGALAGDLVTTPAGKAQPAVLFNFAAFEAARNPDHGAGPGAKYGDPPIDSDPYAFVAYRGGFAAVDAAGNDLLWIKGGKVSVLAVFPTERERLPRAIGKKIGAPASTTSIVVQSVPTSVTVGPDGALYVGELTGTPFASGTARVWRVVPGKKPTVYASGFTNISDIAFEGKNLLVLEMTTKGLLGPASPGALVRVAPNRRKTVIASKGLLAPTGLVVGANAIYVANDGVYPGSGPGPHGEIVSLRG